MKYYTFYRESDNFDDILNDINLKKTIKFKIKWYNYLMIGIPEDEKQFSYITLKYGDDIKPPDIKDFTPIPNVDYIPKKDKNKFKRLTS